MPILIWKNPIMTSNATDTKHEETISKYISPEITCQMKCTHLLERCVNNSDKDKKNLLLSLIH